MDRSGTNPLKLQLHCDDYYRDYGIVDPALEILMDNSFRWYEMEFHDDSLPPPYASVFGRIQGRIPLLRHIDIGCDAEDLLSDAPALSSFTNYLVGIPQLPFEQLTRLHIRYCNIRSNLDEVLRLCQNVQRLELEGILEDPVDEDPPTFQVISGKTETLKVTSNTEDALAYSTGLLLPQLTTIELVGVYVMHRRQYPTWETWDDISFFQQPFRITSLHIESLPISDTQIIGILACLPALRQLCVHDLGPKLDAVGESSPNLTVTPSFFQHLIISPAAEHTIPRLTRLILKAGYEGFDAAGLVDMVSSRWNPRDATVDCLRFVELRLIGEDENELPTELLALEPLKTGGLQVIASVVRW